MAFGRVCRPLDFLRCFLVAVEAQRAQKTPEMELPRRAPHEIAYELLERLAKEGLVAKGQVKEYYSPNGYCAALY